MLEWVAISFSRGSSRPRDWTCVSCISCIGRWILYHWATREACMCVCVCVCVSFFLIKGNSWVVIKGDNSRIGWMGGWAICLRLPHLAVDSSAHGKKCFSATYKNRTEMLCWSESINQKEFLKYPFFNWLLWMTNLRECDGNDDDLWVEWGRKEKNSLLKLSKSEANGLQENQGPNFFQIFICL